MIRIKKCGKCNGDGIIWPKEGKFVFNDNRMHPSFFGHCVHCGGCNVRNLPGVGFVEIIEDDMNYEIEFPDWFDKNNQELLENFRDVMLAIAEREDITLGKILDDGELFTDIEMIDDDKVFLVSLDDLCRKALKGDFW